MAYYLTEKLRRHAGREEQPGRQYSADVLLRQSPVRFGPHICSGWRRDDPINNVVRLTKGELFHIDRRLFTCIEFDGRNALPGALWDIDEMPEKDQILQLNRAATAQKLIAEQLQDWAMHVLRLFTAAIDAVPRSSWRTTPGRCGTFPATSSRRRWSGPTVSTMRAPPGKRRCARSWLRPDQVRGSHPRQGHPFSVYERRLERVWNAMVARSRWSAIRWWHQDEHKQAHVLLASGDSSSSPIITVFC